MTTVLPKDKLNPEVYFWYLKKAGKKQWGWLFQRDVLTKVNLNKTLSKLELSMNKKFYMKKKPLSKCENTAKCGGPPFIPRLLSKHFCLQPFYHKDWLFFTVLFAKSVNLDLQIPGKCIFNTLFDFREYLVHCW